MPWAASAVEIARDNLKMELMQKSWESVQKKSTCMAPNWEGRKKDLKKFSHSAAPSSPWSSDGRSASIEKHLRKENWGKTAGQVYMWLHGKGLIMWV